MNQSIRVAHLWLALFLLPGLGLATPFAYIPNSGSNNVSVIDTATVTVVATVGVGINPIAFGQFIGVAGGADANSVEDWDRGTAAGRGVVTKQKGINSSGMTGVAI